MKILVVGGGGREHALAWKLAMSPSVEQIFVAPGNAGTQWSRRAGRAASRNVPIAADNVEQLVSFASSQQIDLTVIGPEAPLALGIVDAFQAAGLRVFGPTRAAARLEASKAFSKAFMRRHHIPTAAYETFTDLEAAREFVQAFGKPVVIKADGLAAGKGVIVCDSADDADEALRRILVEREFGSAGAVVVIEERLYGQEISALAFSDGHQIALLPLARDHKRIFDGDQGANTGGMGAYAPVPDVSPDLQAQIIEAVLQPTIDGMAAEGSPYVGVLYAGLMLTGDGIRVLEFNCRFGDPETQAILPLFAGDLAETLMACTEGRLRADVQWHDGACASVVLASPGYPGSYPKGLPITGASFEADDMVVFHAGTVEQGGQVVTAGGRVLAISGRGDTLDAALSRAYEGVEQIHFDGMQYRRDIGRVGVAT